MSLQYRVLPQVRMAELKRLLAKKSGIRIIEAHDGLSALVGATAEEMVGEGPPIAFDGLWISSLTDSAAKGHPDIEVIDLSSRLQTIQEILCVTHKLVIVDGDTGGDPIQFEYFCSKLEALGVSAVVIEDKQYPKRNSLDKEAIQILEDPYEFSMKINRGKAVCLSDDFMIFARIESFIANLGLDDALMRASIYLDSRADGILIHSNSSSPEEILAFKEGYLNLCEKKGVTKPLVCVPTTYNHTPDRTLFEHGFDIVIHANQPLRAAFQAMKEACHSILKHDRSFEISQRIATVQEILSAVGFLDVKEKDLQFLKPMPPAVLLAAAKPEGFSNTNFEHLAISDIPIAGQSLLERQFFTLKRERISNVILISGYASSKCSISSIRCLYNDRFGLTKTADSLMLARRQFEQGFLLIFGDVFFDRRLLSNYLLEANADIVLLIDNSYNLQAKKYIKPNLDLVKIRLSEEATLRRPNLRFQVVEDIGETVLLDEATHEFTGLAKFSKRGAEQLCKAYDELVMSSDPLDAIDFNQLIRQLIRSRVDVRALEIHYGWSEVHTINDVLAIERNIYGD